MRSALTAVLVAVAGCDGVFGLSAGSPVDARAVDAPPAPIAVVDMGKMGGSAGELVVSTTLPNAVAHDDVIVAVAYRTNALTSVFDDAGNTYEATQISGLATQSQSFLSIYIATDIAIPVPPLMVSATTSTGTDNSRDAVSIAAFDVSGLAATPIDNSASGKNNSSDESTAGLTAVADVPQLLYFAASTHSDGSSPTTAGSGFTELVDLVDDGTNLATVFAEYRVGPPEVGANATASLDGKSLNWAMGLVTFK